LGGLPRDKVSAFGWLELALLEKYPPAHDTMDSLLDIISADAKAGKPGAQYVWGVAHQIGVPGLIRQDAHAAYLAYRDAAAGGWLIAEDAMQRLCSGNRQACF